MTAATWIVPALEDGVASGCLNCGGHSSEHPLDGMLGVGFGMCFVLKGDDTVWYEDTRSDDDPPLLQQFEDMALADPDHDWRVVYEAPLWSGTWQRQDVGKWLLIERGEGFA